MSIGRNMHVDAQGRIDLVTEAESTVSPIFDVRRSGDLLSFSYRSNDDVDPVRVAIPDANTAELALLLPEEARQELAADGILVPKPFRLAKSR